MLALTAWRENRGGGQPGMQSVINVICNRARSRGTSPYAETIRRLQFSSITAPGSPELGLYPQPNDVQWQQAIVLAASAAGGALQDITGGAVDYYAPHGLTPAQTLDAKIALPDGRSFAWPAAWVQSRYQFTAEIAGQLFFREV